METWLLLCALGALLTCPSRAQWAGQEFYLSFLQNYQPNYDTPHFYLYITALNQRADVTVKVPALNFKQERSLNPGEVVTIDLPAGVELYGSVKSSNTVYVEASADVTVTSMNSKLYTTDTSVVYPITEWDTEYYIYTPAIRPRDNFKEFSVTNGKEKNRVQVFPQSHIKFEGRHYQPGKPMEIELQPYESVQLQSRDDLSGSRVAAQHPVAVFSGHTCTWRFSACDHVYEQLLPVSRWGTNFIVPSVSFQKNFDSVFILASQDTKVNVQDGQINKVMRLSKGQVKEIRYRYPETLSIEADHGIQVLLLFNGVLGGSKSSYDPFLMTILSTNRFCSSYSIEAKKTFNKNQALIVAKENAIAQLRLNGAKLPHNIKWKKVAATEFMWAQINLPSGNNRHTVTSSGSGFGLYGIGFSIWDGYGSPAQCLQPAERESGTCWAMGDPHYLSFDGHRYDFMGTCTYVISKKCAADGHLSDFEVLAQNENRGNLRVSYVALVTVKVYGYNITVVRTEKGRVRIDNSLWSLPITLNNDSLMILQSGRYVVIQTSFGLTVKYDWRHALVVTLTNNYAGTTCGLCGNFNGNSTDDFATPSGSQAGSAVEFGRSWKVPGLVKDDNCRDDCVGGCESCDHGMLRISEVEKFCGLITLALNGPFNKCHSVVNPQAYLENCKYDICMGGGLRQFLCRALEDYTDACQSAGVEVHDWRKIAKCSVNCPANSHYELCGNACPATCTDPNAPSKCKRPCVEICTCNNGYVLSGDRCVPAAQCGCTYEGHYVPAGEIFWPDKDCQKQCKCVAETRRVECQDKGCRAGETCQVIDGIRKCHPVSQSTCHAVGDPHYSTFDNKKFDFQGTCVYQLVAVCSKDDSLVPFEVLVQNENRGRKVVSFTKLVEIKVYSLSIVISKTHKGRIMVNGELVNLPITLSEGQVSVFKSGCYAVVTTTFGLKVSFNWGSAVFVTLPSTYRDSVCGLCGNYNGKPQDDLIPKNGTEVVSAKEFGTSWKVTEITGCVDSCNGECPDCDQTEKVKYEKEDFCGILKDPTGPFRDCHAKVNPDDFFEDCVYDACIYKGRKEVVCQAITSYTSACQDVGAKVYNWRTKEFCAMKCPVYTHYELCGPACPVTCKSLVPPQGCQAQCEEGCYCDEGYILSGDQCVPFSDCGCEYGDQYYRIGQVFYPNGNCQEECECKKDGEVECKKFSCGPNEKCMIKDGVQKCHPVGKGVCYTSGDSHYLSFDGLKFDFHGTCTYTLSKSCNLEGSHLVAFSVQVQNAQWGQMKTKLVAVDVYGFTIILKSTMFGVLVNGIVHNLPINLNNGAVQIYQKGINYVIQTDFGLHVTSDLTYHVSVTVPGNYQNKVCGLCGNFNRNNSDDFQMPNGELTENENMFGKSWMVNIPNVFCQNGCEGNMCPVCDPARKVVLSKPTHCGIITAPEGPFAPCHSKVNPQPYFDGCVFDVCVSNGDWKVLCDSVTAYAFHCHMAGVDIKNWRTSSFCPMKCPANSHYEVCLDPCSASCLGLTEIVQCSTSCTEGCECDAGFLFDGQTCVNETECGCYDNGKTYKLGQAEVDKECKSKCVCQESGEMKCENLTCAAEEVCGVRDGVQDCHVKQGYCTVSSGGHLTSFDDMSGGVGGPGAFDLVSLCDEDTALWFRVVVDARVCSYCGATQVATVYVYFNNTSIIVNREHLVWVNGKKVSLPSKLTNELSIHISDMTVTIEWASALRVTYSLSQEVTVIIHNSLSGKMCGVCGNYNEDAKDDMRTADGKSTTDVAAVVDSWNTEEISRCGL